MQKGREGRKEKIVIREGKEMNERERRNRG